MKNTNTILPTVSAGGGGGGGKLGLTHTHSHTQDSLLRWLCFPSWVIMKAGGPGSCLVHCGNTVIRFSTKGKERSPHRHRKTRDKETKREVRDLFKSSKSLFPGQHLHQSHTEGCIPRVQVCHGPRTGVLPEKRGERGQSSNNK